MSRKTIRPGLKATLEYGPIAAFFLAYILLKDRVFIVAGQEYSGFIAATALFIPILAICTFALWRLTGHISKMQIVTLVLVVLFGGLSLWFNDERFFKMKPTLIYLLFAAILGFGLLRGKSYLEVVLGENLPLQRQGWMVLTRRLALFFAVLAMANELVWRTMSTSAWVNFKTFGLTLGIFAFFMTQSGLFSKYGIEEKPAGED